MRGAWAGVLASLVLAAPTAAAPGDVPDTEAARAALVRCDAGLADRPRPPALLLHGTGVNAEINWSWGYAKDLRERGHGICVFDLPRAGAVDIQDSVLLTIAAIRKAYAGGGRREIAVVGHSQGGAQIMLALRMRPELAALVEDVIGLAGAYSHGSEAVRDDCRDGCSPAFHQFATGSRLLTALEDRPLPSGVDFTAIGTLHDTVVTPQPAANALAGARSIQIQDVCPGRQFVAELDHIYMAADAVAHALAVDALGHPGPADPARVPATTCALQLFPTADLVGFAAITPGLLSAFSADRSGDEVQAEPPLRCPLATERCLTGVRLVRRRVALGGVVRVRVRASEPIQVRVGRGAARRVAGAATTVRVRVGRRLGLRRLVVQTRPEAGGRWRDARTLRVRVVR